MGKKLIGYRGQWYDVTSFVKHHPGGEVIEKFVGQDATCAIESMHKFDVLSNRKPGMLNCICILNFLVRPIKFSGLFKKSPQLFFVTNGQGKSNFFQILGVIQVVIFGLSANMSMYEKKFN